MSANEWSDTEVGKEEERLLCKLEAEYEEAKELPLSDPETIEIDLKLFSEGPRNRLRDLLIHPDGVKGTSQDAKNLRYPYTARSGS